MVMKNDELIEQLSNLKLEEKCIKRNLDKMFIDIEERKRMFSKLRENKRNQEQIKFKIRLEREMRNEK